MAILRQFIDFFRLTEAETSILKNEIKAENIRRIFYLTLIAVPASLFHVVYFWLNLTNSAGIEREWRTYIIYSHAFIVLAVSTISVLIYFFSVRPKKDSIVATFGIQAVIVLLLTGGSAIATFDQLVTPAINPFILTSMIAAIVILNRPLFAIIYYSGAYLLFYFLIELTQHNPDILLSNRVNAVTITGIGLCLSFIFWQMYLVRIKQDRIIEKQQKELLGNYNKLMYYSEELEESNATKDKLFSVIAHDLRNPLSALIGLTTILTEDFEILSQAEIRKTLSILDKESKLTYDLLINLLEWSKTQRKKLVSAPEVLVLTDQISGMFRQLENTAKNKEITLNNQVDKNLKIFADLSMLQSVLKNLLTNGIKFTEKGGQITVSAELKEGLIEVSVQDTGTGMDSEKIANLFSLNNSYSSSGTENEKGTGLGLQICKEFVEINGGEIRVISEVGKGSTFTFSVPANE
ncbi:MAG: HAMP domain-containing sensor histidine kinase [Prolixibacteraceae bacterium]|jgi:signal transduction histidine kinase